MRDGAPVNTTVTQTAQQAVRVVDDYRTHPVPDSSTILSSLNLTQDSDQTGNSDESDFHNRHGSISWEKRDEGGSLVGGGMFTLWDGTTTIKVTDGGTNDLEHNIGQIKIGVMTLDKSTVDEKVVP